MNKVINYRFNSIANQIKFLILDEKESFNFKYVEAYLFYNPCCAKAY
jgi:hypothetical protein